MIYDFINNICDILNIPVPTISYNTLNFQTDTMLAQVDLSGKTIYIKKYDNPNPDQFFSIAHELRHVWQIKNDNKSFLSEYKSADLMKSIEEYNLQPAEIDANAFAYIIMVDFFGIKPLFYGLSDNVKSRIFKHIDEIVTELSE